MVTRNLHVWWKELVAACIMAFAAAPLVSCAPSEPASTAEPIYTEHKMNADDAINASRQNAITRAVKVCSPAVVGINVTAVHTQYYRDPFEEMFRMYGERSRTYSQKYEVQGLGSGFLISSDGYIVTNDHVAGNATKIVISMTNGEKYDAEIIGTDATTDVTLLKIKGENFPYLKLSNSDDVQIGEWAIAFGNPFGLFTINSKPTVTVGVVSNNGVDFTQPDESSNNYRVYRGMIQTDAAISSGNSGGPLVNSLGDVIGVNTVIYSTAQSNRGAGSIGIGFAIPINRVKYVIDKLKKSGKIDRDFWTGMELEELDARTARAYGLKRTDGVLVREVRGGPAEAAGLEPGDVIIEANGSKIHNGEELTIMLLDSEADGKLKLTIDRQGSESEKTIVLTKRPMKPNGRRN